MVVLVNIPTVQTWLVQQVAQSFSKKLNTRVTIDRVELSLFNKLLLRGVMVEDQQKDTLLYAGTARLNITDWFFLRDRATVKYLSLDDAQVNMHRTDSVWNYRFITDYFTTPKTKGGSKGIEFDLRELHLRNIVFIKNDGWIGQDMQVALDELDLSMDGIDYKKKEAVINNLTLRRPVFYQSDFKGNRPPQPNLTNILKKIPVLSEFKWNNSGWKVKLKKLSIIDGKFQNEKETARAPYTDRFDGQHILFSSINGSISNLEAVNDTLRGDVQLSAVEKSGLKVKQLDARMTFTPVLMEFRDLTLKTNRSTLGDYYSMKYDAFNKDMGNFISKVLLEGHFKNSELHSDDLAIFAPNLKNWNRIFFFDGNAKGTVENFSAKDMKITSGMSYLEGDLSMRGLPNINSTFIDIRAKNFTSHYRDLVSIVPSIRKVTQPALHQLGKIRFSGNATGFLSDFVTEGTVESALGNLRADLNIKLPSNAPAAYSGKLSTPGFQIGSFLDNDQFGKISLDGNVQGQGFSLADLNVNFDGNISRVDWGPHTFTNIYVVGDFEKKFFKGHLTINDPKVQIKSLDGTISLSGKAMDLNADADITYIDLFKLGLSKKDLRLRGLFSLNFTGNNIDDFLGNARVYNASLLSDSNRLSFDSLNLSSYLDGDRKTLSLRSNEIDARLDGKFNILDLPNSFTFFLSRYYPAYIEKPRYAVSNQDFNFSIKTKDITDYLRLIDPRISGFNNSLLSGNINLVNSELRLLADVPDFSFDGKTFSNVKLEGKGNIDTLTADLSVANIRITDSLYFPQTNLKLTANNDLSFIQLKTSAGKNLNDAELNASVQTMADGVRINFSPSSFIINDKKWLLEKDGELTVRKNYIDANEIKFTHGREQIIISSELSDETDQTHIIARLKDVAIEDFAPLVVKKPKLKGLLTGTATLRNPFGKTSIEFSGAADSFSMDKKYMGDVFLEANSNLVSGLVNFEASARDSAFDFDLAGSYNYKDSLNTLGINLEGRKIDLEVLKPYLGAIFEDITGTATTSLKVSGTPKHLYLTGEALIDSASLLVSYTQCRYNLRDETIYFRPDEIDLGRMMIRDTLGNEGVVSGRMSHTFFEKFSFHTLSLETQRMLLLNTERKDNEQFYGNVIGYANMTLDGPITGMVMNIDGQPSSIDSSHLYLPTGSSKESGAIDYIEFIQFGSPMKERGTSEVANILVNLNVNANPACKVDVILDEATGDILHGQGNGLLNIRVGTKEPLSIRGRYELTKGEYTFNFQTFLQRPFILNRGSITWNGDPYQALIDMEAEYIAKNVDVSVLASAGGYRQKEDITIISHLTGILQQPEIEFEFRLPEKSDIKNDYIAVKKLADFQNDKAEMNKQVASLLLFNTFISNNQSFLSTENTIAIATNTIGGIVSGWLTTMFNRELEKATNGIISTYIDINPTLNIQAAASQLQANVRAGLKVLLSNRLFVLIGGNIEYNNPATLQLARRGLITPDITIEWLLNKDGSLRVVGFNRTSIYLTVGQRNRSGVQLSYRKDYDRLGDMFRSKKQIEMINEKRRKGE